QKAVVELLQGRDAVHFAKSLVPTIEDWQSILSTNTTVQDPDPLKSFRNSTEGQRRSMERSALALLTKANELHVDFSRGKLQASIAANERNKGLGSTHYPTLQAKDESLPWAEKVEVILNVDLGPTNAASGEYKVAVRGLMKFPAGWRSSQDIQWVSFPTN